MAKKERFFLVSPFHPEFAKIHEALAEAASRFQYLALDRSDTQRPGENKLFQEIRERIRSAAFVVADISLDPRCRGQNPNAMLEAGFAMGMGKEPFFISRQPIDLPSDVNQYRVFSYDPRLPQEDLVEEFERFLEEILLLVGIDTDRVVRKRTTQAELLRWLNTITRTLRDRVRATYVDESGLWDVKMVTFLPSKCTFSLTHKLAEVEKTSLGEAIDEIIVECGAFYSLWNRSDTPLRISVRKLTNGRREVESDCFPISLSEPIETVSEETVYAKFEEKLDEILPRFTPGLSRHAPLAKRLSVMEQVASAVRRLEMPGLSVRSRALKWGVGGCWWEFEIESDKSLLTFSVDFRRWEQSANQFPYWVRMEPKNLADQADLEQWLKRYPTCEFIEFGEGGWTIPLKAGIDQPAEAVAFAFQELVGQIVGRYKIEAPESGAIAAEVEVVEAPDIRFSCSSCHVLLTVKNQFAGRKVRCPKCSTIDTVPQPT